MGIIRSLTRTVKYFFPYIDRVISILIDKDTSDRRKIA